MTREMLRELGIEDKDIIDTIMGEHGKSIEKLKSTNNELQVKISELDNYIPKTEFEKQISDVKSGYESQIEELNTKLHEQHYNHKMENLFSQYKFSNPYAEKAIKSEFIEKQFKLNEEGLFGDDVNEYFSIIKETAPNVFLEEEKAQKNVNVGIEIKNKPTEPQSDPFLEGFNKK